MQPINKRKLIRKCKIQTVPMTYDYKNAREIYTHKKIVTNINTFCTYEFLNHID